MCPSTLCAGSATHSVTFTLPFEDTQPQSWRDDQEAKAKGGAAPEALATALAHTLEAAMRLLGAQGAVLRALVPDGCLVGIAVCGQATALRPHERSIAADTGLCARALARNAVVSALSLADVGGGAAAAAASATLPVTAIPLFHRGKGVGVLTLQFAAGASLDEREPALLKGLRALLAANLGDALQERETIKAALLAQRQALAGEVHDSVAQTLSFVKMRLPLLQDAIGNQDAGAALRYCDDLRMAVGSAHTNLRQLLTEFRCPVAPEGLRHALQSSILNFSQRTRVPLTFDDQAPDLILSAAQESQIFHIVQEALANIAKHASARSAWLRLAQADGRVEVAIEDDGRGISIDDDVEGGHHFGLGIMRERAARLGGRFEVSARDGGGTRLRLTFALLAVPSTGAQ